MSTELQESDLAILKEFHEFVRDDEFDQENQNDWRIRLARRYYDGLYKEYAITDLTHYAAGLIGFRWRTEQEVLLGKGQDYCAAISCSSKEGMKVLEVPFGYEEQGIAKAELVKITLCKKCTKKIKYYYQEQERKIENTSVIEENIQEQPSKKKPKH